MVRRRGHRRSNGAICGWPRALPPISSCSGSIVATARAWKRRLPISIPTWRPRGRPGRCQPPQDLFADNTYYRGALTLHALRLHVGDRDFFRTLRAYYRTYRNKNATSADFIDVAARQSDRGGVRRLLHAWLYDQAVPPMPGARRKRGRPARLLRRPWGSGFGGTDGLGDGHLNLSALISAAHASGDQIACRNTYRGEPPSVVRGVLFRSRTFVNFAT